MAIRWKLSILGLYQYDKTIFDKFQIPAGLDRETVIDAICMETAELSTIYTSPASLAFALKNFSARRLPAWERAYNALAARYDLLTTESTSETAKRTPDLSRVSNSTRTPNTTRSVDTTRTPDLTAEGQNGGSDSRTEQVSGFNGNQLETRSKTTTELGSTNTVHTHGTENTNSTEKNSGTENTTSSDRETGTDTTVRTKSGYTTPPQDRIQAELKLCAQTVSNMIVHEVKYNLCVMVY